MKRIICLTILLLLIASNVFAATWITTYENNRFLLAYDADVIQHFAAKGRNPAMTVGRYMYKSKVKDFIAMYQVAIVNETREFNNFRACNILNGQSMGCNDLVHNWQRYPEDQLATIIDGILNHQ